MDWISLSIGAAAYEEIYGLGLQYSRWNQRGLIIPIMSSEQGVGRGLQPVTKALNVEAGHSGGTWYTTYSASNSYITNAGRGTAFNTTAIGHADLDSPRGKNRQFNASAPGTLEFAYWGVRRLQGTILVPERTADFEFGAAEPRSTSTSLRLRPSTSTSTTANRMLAVVSALSNVTGRMHPLPDWSQQGAIIGTEGGDAFVSTTIAQLQEWKVPLVGVWLQDWSGEVKYVEGARVEWNWQLNTAWYKVRPAFLLLFSFCIC